MEESISDYAASIGSKSASLNPFLSRAQLFKSGFRKRINPFKLFGKQRKVFHLRTPTQSVYEQQKQGKS